MNVSPGIVGLPNVEQSTLFNTVTNKSVTIENFILTWNNAATRYTTRKNLLNWMDGMKQKRQEKFGLKEKNILFRMETLSRYDMEAKVTQ